MKSWLYLTGRAFQLMGLMAMPSALWVGFLGHNEAGSIAIFTASIVVFYLGTWILQGAKR